MGDFNYLVIEGMYLLNGANYQYYTSVTLFKGEASNAIALKNGSSGETIDIVVV